MASLFDFSQAISKLNKEKKFAETLKYFKDSKNEFTPEQIGLNKYIVYDMISALIETNHYDVIFTFIEQHNVVLEPKSFSYLLKKFKGKPSVNWLVVNKFCDLVSVDLLDTECKTIEVERKGEKKPMELASSKEDWYAIKTKALFEIKQYEECFALSKKALESFEKFHYSNDVWFARRIALSKKYLGNSAEALNELLQVLRRKKEWFIQKELADLYKEKGDIENAFKLAIEAINNFGDLEYKVDLLFLLGELLKAKGQDDLAFKHLSLSRLIRIDEEWNNPPKLSSALGQFGKENIPVEKLQELKNELRKYWNSFKPQQNNTRQNTDQYLLGKIDKILNDNEKGVNGFIKYDANKSVYFAVSSNYKIKEVLKIGTEVKFKILSATEEKKERAVEINLK
jgi:tetratricopeptide (TPR) repeat protein